MRVRWKQVLMYGVAIFLGSLLMGGGCFTGGWCAAQVLDETGLY